MPSPSPAHNRVSRFTLDGDVAVPGSETVLIDLPKDVTTNETNFEYPEKINLPGFRPRTQGHAKQIRQAARLLDEARKPIIIAGHGIILSGAYDELRQFAEKTNIPVMTTLLGISAFPYAALLYRHDASPLCLK